MAMNCSFLLGDDCAGKMLRCGCLSGEASPLSSCGVNSRWWDDLEVEPKEGPEVYDPLVARLPNDPFGMNLETTSATITVAIASCIEDLRARSGARTFGSGGNNNGFIVDLLSSTLTSAPNPWPHGHMGASERYYWSGDPSGGGDAPWSQRSGFVASSSQNATLECCGVHGAAPREFMENPSSSYHAAAPTEFMEIPSSSYHAASPFCDTVDAAPGQEGNDAHPGMFIALGYLALRDVLSVEMVCTSLRAAVRSEFCSWKCIHIDSLLGDKISDADLLRLTQKSPGALQCLSLVCCKNITDQGLNAVLQSNPQLTKLGIYGNVRITHQGLLDNLKLFNMQASVGIQKLRVKLATLSKEDYEELLSMLKIDKGLRLHKQEPRIFHADCFLLDQHAGGAPDYFSLDLHDEYAFDIDWCPQCDSYKHVYDCPVEGCKNSITGTCKGCLACIMRCLQCGRCIDNENDDFEETFSLDKVCQRCIMGGDLPVAEK